MMPSSANEPAAAAATAMSPRRRRCFIVVTAGLVLGVVLAGGELLARWRGYTPFHPARLDVRVEPGGRFYTIKESGGYGQLPGHFDVTLPSGWHFRVTHDTNGLRLTHPAGVAGTNPQKPELWILGCSLTHGWSLNDEETYPWRVQQAMPEFEVVNAGIEGYGTLQSRLFFQELLAHRGKPSIAIVAYGTFHDLRNTFVRERRKSLVSFREFSSLQQPFARINRRGDLDYGMAPLAYREFPLMRISALMHFTEQQYNLWEIARADSSRVSAELLRRWAAYCRDEHIRFIVAGISSDSGPMLDCLRRLGLETVDISVKLSEPGNTNIPHDNHPSARANAVYAQRLTSYLRAHPEAMKGSAP